MAHSQGGFTRGDFPVAEAYYDTAITLPLFPEMTVSDVDYVVDIVQQVEGLARR